MSQVKLFREFMKSHFDDMDYYETDQQRKLPQPPLQKDYDKNGEIINLPEVDNEVLKERDIYLCLKKRRSQRKYTDDSLTLKELSFLLWATQGVDQVVNNGYATRRPVPSAGARHPFETYLAVNRVEGLKKGVYRYLHLTHQLIYLFECDGLEGKISEVSNNQKFVGQGAVTFFWSCVPYRGEWRYHSTSHKTMLLDAGHVCQNLYIACEAIGCGTCAVASYNQKALDEFLKLDGEDEYVVYLASVGKI